MIRRPEATVPNSSWGRCTLHHRQRAVQTHLFAVASLEPNLPKTSLTPESKSCWSPLRVAGGIAATQTHTHTPHVPTCTHTPHMCLMHTHTRPCTHTHTFSPAQAPHLQILHHKGGPASWQVEHLDGTRRPHQARAPEGLQAGQLPLKHLPGLHQNTP